MATRRNQARTTGGNAVPEPSQNPRPESPREHTPEAPPPPVDRITRLENQVQQLTLLLTGFLDRQQQPPDQHIHPGRGQESLLPEGSSRRGPPPQDRVQGSRPEEQGESSGVAQQERRLRQLEEEIAALRPRRGEGRGLTVNQPLTPEVMAAVPPERLRIPAIKLYAGTTDPTDHLDLFSSHMMVQEASDAMWCRVFSATLEGHARAWYSNLAHHSIASFAQLRDSFLSHFAPLRRHRRSTMALVSLKQNQGETLKEFVSRFNMEALSIEGFDQNVAMVAFQNALRPGPFAQSLAKTPPLSFTDILGRAAKYINAEEVMQAKRAEQADKKEKKGPAEERKGRDRREDRREKPQSRWDSGNFTPLNAPRAEILATIEDRDYLRKPPPMKAPADKRNRNKYCRFHRDHGHDTEECHQLKL